MQDDGTLIRYWRKRRGLTQRVLARRVGCSIRTLVRWEHGETVPGGHRLIALAEALRVPPDLLLAPERTSAKMGGPGDPPALRR